MKEYTIVLTFQATKIESVPDDFETTPKKIKGEYEKLMNIAALSVNAFDDIKITKAQLFDTTRNFDKEKNNELE